jgi:hypothetical protein
LWPPIVPNFTIEICASCMGDGVAVATAVRSRRLSRTGSGVSRKKLQKPSLTIGVATVLIDGFFRIFSGSGFPKMWIKIAGKKWSVFGKEKSGGSGRQSGRPSARKVPMEDHDETVNPIFSCFIDGRFFRFLETRGPRFLKRPVITRRKVVSFWNTKRRKVLSQQTFHFWCFKMIQLFGLIAEQAGLGRNARSVNRKVNHLNRF